MTATELLNTVLSSGGTLGLIAYIWHDSKSRQDMLIQSLNKLEVAFLRRNTECVEKFAKQEDLESVEQRTRVLETSMAKREH